MDDLRTWCREGLVAGLHALEESRRALRDGDPEAAASMRRLAHLLQGTASTYGFDDVSRAAGALTDDAPPAPEAVEGLVGALQRATAVAGSGARTDVLVVEDDPVASRVLQAALEDGHRNVVVVRSGAQARAWLETGEPALIVLDLGLPDMDGRALLQWLREDALRAEVPVIVLTGRDVKLARAECVALGADEYIRKPFDPEAFRDAAAAHLRRGTRRQPARLAAAGAVREEFEGLTGGSHAMEEIYRRIELSAPTDVTVLLTGESGTGKEMAARAMHARSKRRAKPFVAVNCSALPETLLESELFGHVKGAFTDAVRDKPGVFQSADGGTLFLDEIGDLSPLLQLKLLRVLQEREVRRVGDDRPYKVDVRLLAATNRDLRALLGSRVIRDDFYYRVRVFEIRMPALRDRREDIPLLVRRFLGELEEAKRKDVRGLTREALAALVEYPWPGNVRELRNAMEHALVTVRGRHATLSDLPAEIRGWTPRRGGLIASGDDPERARVAAALAEAGGHRARAARLLGISRITLWKRLRRLGLQPGRPVEDSA